MNGKGNWKRNKIINEKLFDMKISKTSPFIIAWNMYLNYAKDGTNNNNCNALKKLGWSGYDTDPEQIKAKDFKRPPFKNPSTAHQTLVHMIW